MQHTREVFDWADPFQLVEQRPTRAHGAGRTHAYARKSFARFSALSSRRPIEICQMGELGLRPVDPKYGGAGSACRLV